MRGDGLRLFNSVGIGPPQPARPGLFLPKCRQQPGILSRTARRQTGMYGGARFPKLEFGLARPKLELLVAE